MKQLTYLIPTLLLAMPTATTAHAQSATPGPLNATAHAGSEPLNICYFSFNDERELTETQALMKRIERETGLRVNVKEYLTPPPDQAGAQPNPRLAFERMVKSGVRCDGLVISGHHTGAWGGKRAKGTLPMDFLETMSCDPKHADWFRNVNAAWLQGCRTMGVGEIQPDDQQADADFHTNRVGEVLEEDGLGQNYQQLNVEFANTLDQDNPLASRYLRLFPSAKVFGWTRSAPGEKVGSWKSMLFHMAQITRIMGDGTAYPDQGPGADKLSPENAARYANAVLASLTRFSAENRGCENIAVEGWLAHGNVGKPGKYFFDNDDLKASPSLAASGDELLLKAKEIDCLLKAAAKARNPQLMGDVLDRIAANPEFLRYSFNSLVDLRAELARAGSGTKADPKAKEVADLMLMRMKGNQPLVAFLKGKMVSKQVGILQRTDYYKLFQLLTGEKDVALEADIRTRAAAELTRPLPAWPAPLAPGATPAQLEAYELRYKSVKRSRGLSNTHRMVIIQSVAKNGLGAQALYEETLATQPDADALVVLAQQARNAGVISPDNLRMIVMSPKADGDVARAVMKAMPQAEVNQPGSSYARLHNAIAADLQARFPAQAPAGNQAPMDIRAPAAPAPVPARDPVTGFFQNIFGR